MQLQQLESPACLLIKQHASLLYQNFQVGLLKPSIVFVKDKLTVYLAEHFSCFMANIYLFTFILIDLIIIFVNAEIFSSLRVVRLLYELVHERSVLIYSVEVNRGCTVYQ